MGPLVWFTLCVLVLAQISDQPEVTARQTDWQACQDCHEVEGANLPPLSVFRPAQLLQQKVECLDCHTRFELVSVGGDFTHPVRSVGVHVDCTMCHPAVAHGSGAAPPLPTGDYNHEGCFACHRNIEAKFSMGSGHRVTVSCRDCHPPHIQLDAALPMSLVPTDAQSAFGGSFDWYGSNQACFRCHGPAQLMMQVTSGFVTLNTENYHDIHVTNGVLCVECHDPHGSLHSPMIASEPPSGEILVFIEGIDGGTCAVVCHGVNHDGWRYINQVQ